MKTLNRILDRIEESPEVEDIPGLLAIIGKLREDRNRHLLTIAVNERTFGDIVAEHDAELFELIKESWLE